MPKFRRAALALLTAAAVTAAGATFASAASASDSKLYSTYSFAMHYHDQSVDIVSHTCNFTLHGAEFTSASPEYSRTWLSNISGKCKPGYPIQYNRTGCAYPPRRGEFWRDGPIRKGKGTINSNYSGVTCNQYAHGVIIDVWGWWNVGFGWKGDHLYHI